MMRTFQPARTGSALGRSGPRTGASRTALLHTSARTTLGSTRLTLSYSAVIETGTFSFIFCAAACSEGRIPRATNDINSTTVENRSSRVY